MDDATSALTRDEGFAALTRRLRAPLTHFFLRRSKSSADAEEMVQDLFLRLMRRADLMSLQNVDGSEQARGRGLHVEINDAVAEYDAPDAEQIIAGRQRLKRMLAALDALPPRARAVVILRRFENLTYPQIAQRLGISVSAVEKHMVRAMSALRVDLVEGDR
jgi:RNA polymerase sigma-70 factor (ECF subfamily)